MRIPSARTFLIVGFAISAASVAVNTFVLSAIGSRLKAANSEYYGLQDALHKQITQLTQADLKFDVYRVMHNLADTAPAANAGDERKDAKEILQGFLVKFYAAANDISPVEVNRIAVDEAGDALAKLKQDLELIQSLQQSKDPAALAKLASILEKLGKEELPPKSKLAAKLREVGKYAEAEATTTDTLELMYRVFPVMESLTRQLSESIERKEDRMRELERERSSLETQAGYASYAAISLQIFGLMFIFARDILRDIAKDK
jgi:hypothetical protein